MKKLQPPLHEPLSNYPKRLKTHNSDRFSQSISPNLPNLQRPRQESQSTTSSISKRAPNEHREDIRRKQHNEVERRRRDKINMWIIELSKIVPDCVDNQHKPSKSKGGILAKTHEYLLQLIRSNNDMLEKIENYRAIPLDANTEEVVQHRLRYMKYENGVLKKKLANANAELEEAKEDRDDIIDQLRSQGIKIRLKEEEHEEMKTEEIKPGEIKHGVIKSGERKPEKIKSGNRLKSCMKKTKATELKEASKQDGKKAFKQDGATIRDENKINCMVNSFKRQNSLDRFNSMERFNLNQTNSFNRTSSLDRTDNNLKRSNNLAYTCSANFNVNSDRTYNNQLATRNNSKNYKAPTFNTRNLTDINTPLPQHTITHQHIQHQIHPTNIHPTNTPYINNLQRPSINAPPSIIHEHVDLTLSNNTESTMDSMTECSSPMNEVIEICNPDHEQTNLYYNNNNNKRFHSMTTAEEIIVANSNENKSTNDQVFPAGRTPHSWPNLGRPPKRHSWS